MNSEKKASEKLYSQQFILMWCANFFVLTSLSSFFLFPLFIIDHGGNKSDIGILMAAMTLSSVIIRPWISHMVDRFGRKKSYFIGTLIITLMPIIHTFFRGDISDFYAPLMLVRIVLGIGVALGFTASFTYAADIIPPKRLNEGLGMFGITALIGMAVGPAISEPIIKNFGFNAYFLTASAIGTISLILQFFLTETFVPSSLQKNEISFFTVLKRKKIYSVAMLTMLFGVGFAAQGGFVSPYIEHIGLPMISLFFIAYAIAAVLTRLFGGKLADRVGEENIIPWAFAISASGFLSLIIVKNNWLLALSGIITGCGHGFIFPCLNALAIRDESIGIRGKINGIFTGGMDGGMLFGSVILGYIGEWFGFRPIFLATFLMLLSSLGIFFGLLKKAIRHSNHSIKNRAY
jgi:MFS family permease